MAEHYLNFRLTFEQSVNVFVDRAPENVDAPFTEATYLKRFESGLLFIKNVIRKSDLSLLKPDATIKDISLRLSDTVPCLSTMVEPFSTDINNNVRYNMCIMSVVMRVKVSSKREANLLKLKGTYRNFVSSFNDAKVNSYNNLKSIETVEIGE